MSFIEQIENRRIKTLAQDIIGEISSTGQVWDSYHDSIEVITADNYWDVSVRPLRVNDVIAVIR
jgi:hypothetical protein